MWQLMRALSSAENTVQEFNNGRTFKSFEYLFSESLQTICNPIISEEVTNF